MTYKKRNKDKETPEKNGAESMTERLAENPSSAPEVTSLTYRNGEGLERCVTAYPIRWHRHHLHLTQSKVLIGCINDSNEATCDWCTATREVFYDAWSHWSVIVVAENWHRLCVGDWVLAVDIDVKIPESFSCTETKSAACECSN